MLTAPSTAEVISFEPKPQPERFVMLRYSLLDSSAWQSLPPNAQALDAVRITFIARVELGGVTRIEADSVICR